MKVIIEKANYENLENILNRLNFKINPGEKIILKPNWVGPGSSEDGITTDINLVIALANIIKKHKAIPIVAEAPGYDFNEKAYKVLKIKEKLKDIKFVYLRGAKTRKIKTKEKYLRNIEIPEVILDADKIINIPKLKTHVLSQLSIGMKNLVGIPPRKYRREMHVYNLDNTIPELCNIIKPDLTIVDATTMMHGRGPVFGDVIKSNLIIAGTNVFAVDHACCKLLGVNPKDVRHIKKAMQRNLVPKYEIEGKFTPMNIDMPIDDPYMFMVRIAYILDKIQSYITRKTFIGWLFQTWGVRIEIDKNLCDQCGLCVEACPIDAIDLKNKTIIKKKCKEIKCLRCYKICPKKAVYLKGYSLPKEELEKKKNA
ncbi:MAG: DUF362 domain-containing protein [Nanoarchaeota archaeon]